MKFYLPFWPADKIYENFDPWNETKGKRTHCIWDVFRPPPVDGILVSRVNLEKHKEFLKKAEKTGVHSLLNFNGSVMGDCGAFGYIKEESPLYDPVETLQYYLRTGFDIGVSVDHLIVPATYDQKEIRWEITIENAKKTFDELQKGRYEDLRLLGVAQGWDIDSYKKAVKELIEYGFDYVGLGGLVRTPTSKIKELLLEIGRVVHKFEKEHKKKIDLHIFGVAREVLFPLMVKSSISSFDSATFLRRAWIAAEKNYHLNDKAYTAIRFPISKSEDGKLKEQEFFKAIREFEQKKMTIDDFMKTIDNYDPERIQKFSQEYRRTLKDRPWEKCECTICKDIGIHVCIFRMSERNMRRGFHNVFQFSKRFRKFLPKIFVFTNCTMKKDEIVQLIPAFQRYLKSPPFKVFWSNVFDLPIEIGVLSAKFGLIDWSQRIPYYNYKMRESDVPKFVQELKEKLKRYDKIFFIGLGLYRDVAEKVKEKTGFDIQIFPKIELTDRGKLDIIEYTKQMKFFRQAIIQAIPEKCRPNKEEILTKSQSTLEKFTEGSMG